MFRVHERGDSARLLRFRDGVQSDRRLTRRFGAVDLHDPAAGYPADTERDIQRKTTRGNDFDIHASRRVAQFHDGAFAVVLFDLQKHLIERFQFVVVH